MSLHLGFRPVLVVSSADKARDNLSCVSTAPYGFYWREPRRILVHELMTAKRVGDIFGEMQRFGVEFNLADYFPGMGWVNRINGVDRRIAESRRDLEGVFERVIGEHRDWAAADSGERDIIDVLLRVQKESQLTDDQLKTMLLVNSFLYL
ncbi:hypothetical protein SASPL_138877 [Salvia splendens]|uniref:Cytochrome P450 n=1 Tax=Salvia splendens TaxID=180675 RepID=A0A8X8WVJ8_SALSN|nr:hypothetical protein SASPL_138877 [Salvia splendens]